MAATSVLAAMNVIVDRGVAWTTLAVNIGIISGGASILVVRVRRWMRRHLRARGPTVAGPAELSTTSQLLAALVSGLAASVLGFLIVVALPIVASQVRPLEDALLHTATALSPPPPPIRPIIR